MTALLALESGRLREAATVREEDLTGGATMGLVAGETVTVEELLWGVLLPSGNDAAMTMAQHLGGGASSFVAEMNRRAAELGMDATNFHNPHGLHEEGHVSSAADLMNIALALLEYPLFREIVGVAHGRNRRSHARQYERVIGRLSWRERSQDGDDTGGGRMPDCQYRDGWT